MNNFLKKYSLVDVSAYVIVLILAVIPFHAFLSVYASSLIGHYTLIRLWKEYLLALLLLSCIFIFFKDKKLRTKILSNKIFYLIIIYLAIQVIWGAVSYHHKLVGKKALFYGLLLNCRYLIFFLITWAISLKTNLIKDRSIKIIIWPALLVVIFGLAQIFILPNNFLSHFGYNPTTISAYETINHNSKYIRIESTLRGANPLGAYLLIPISIGVVLLIRNRITVKKLLFLLGSFMVLLVTFSRSAWLGAVVSVIVAIFYSLKSKSLKKSMIYILIGLIILASLSIFSLRNNQKVQNIIWHTQTHSTIKTTSDQGHASALKSGFNDVIGSPLGRGPGTAGPASVYNNHPGRIAENYYIQIGQETGWLGIGLFIAINIIIGYELWLRRDNNLALAMFASFIGLFIVNMLSHAWSDDTLAYLWWGMAGVCLAIKFSRNKDVVSD